jgi:hypothetical protein
MDCVNKLTYNQRETVIGFFNKLINSRNKNEDIIFKQSETLLNENEFKQAFECFYSCLGIKEGPIFYRYNKYGYNKDVYINYYIHKFM